MNLSETTIAYLRKVEAGQPKLRPGAGLGMILRYENTFDTETLSDIVDLIRILGEMPEFSLTAPILRYGMITKGTLLFRTIENST